MSENLPNVLFRRQAEPRENAFSLLVPEGWSIDGGIFRINPATHSVQSTSAKIDMTIKREAAGVVMLRFLPSVYYFDPRRSATGMMGMLPVGSNYQGMLVCPVVPPGQFLPQVVFPYAHQGQPVSQVQIIEQRERPDLVQQFLQKATQPMAAGNTYAGGEVIYTYVEGNIHYRERALGVVLDLGAMGAGMWGNLNTWYMRAPQDEFARWEPVFLAVQASLKANPAWQQEELRAQQIATGIFTQQQQAEQVRAQRALQFQRDMQSEMHDIVEHSRNTQAEIRNDHYLFMTNQEEYVNPYTKEIDTASNQWAHRWVTSDGREFYSDNESDNPNGDPHLRQWEWQRSAVRPR